MFEQPLSAIRQHQTSNINPSLMASRLPEPYRKRWGKSVSEVAKIADKLGYVAPSPVCSRIDSTDKRYPKDARVETIYPQLIGNVVEFIAAYKTVGKQAAEDLYFPQACEHIDDMLFPDPLHAKDETGCLKGRKNPINRRNFDDLNPDEQIMMMGDLRRLNDLLNRIDRGFEEAAAEDKLITYDGIVAACEFVAFDNCYRGGHKRYSADKKDSKKFAMEVKPSKVCAARIYWLAERAVKCLNDNAPVQSYQYTYPIDMLEDRRIGINGGRLDFVADNKIIDIKTDKNPEISNANKLQVLIYLAMMQRVRTKKPVLKAAIASVRTNELVEYDWTALPQQVKDELNALIDYADFEYYSYSHGNTYKTLELKAFLHLQ